MGSKKICVVSDFDGTITKKDTLGTFFRSYCYDEQKRKEVSNAFFDGKISAQESLRKEFDLVPNLSPELIAEYLDTIELDEYFADFYRLLQTHNIDLYIASDGMDYFIKTKLSKAQITDYTVISNHGEFINGEFKLSFPNSNPECARKAGTCKCKVVTDLQQKYEQVVYLGDGVTDFCVVGKPDILFAKRRLKTFCEENNIEHVSFETFKDVCESDIFSKIPCLA